MSTEENKAVTEEVGLDNGVTVLRQLADHRSLTTAGIRRSVITARRPRPRGQAGNTTTRIGHR